MTRTNRTHGPRAEESLPPDPANRVITIVAGGTAQLELDVHDYTVPMLAGNISIQGVDASSWTVSVVRSGVKLATWDPKNAENVGPTGAFRIAGEQSGAHRLTLSSPSTPERSDTIEDDVELKRGTSTWALDVATGSLKLPAAMSGEIVLGWTATSGARWSAHVRKSGGQELVVDHVPAGTVRIQAPDQDAMDVTVQAGGVALDGPR
jgi:hypothetical protein